MNFLCLVYADPALDAPEPPAATSVKDACIAKDLALHAKGKLAVASPLLGPETSVVVRYRDGKASQTDGPFLETKEWIAGFMVITAADMAEAVAIATDGPPVGILEIRPLLDERHSVTGADRSVFFQPPATTP